MARRLVTLAAFVVGFGGLGHAAAHLFDFLVGHLLEVDAILLAAARGAGTLDKSINLAVECALSPCNCLSVGVIASEVRVDLRSSGVRFASSSTGGLAAARDRPSFLERLLFLVPSSAPSPSSPSLFFLRRGLSARFFFFLGSSPSPAVRLRLCTPICLTVSSSMACAGRSSIAMLLASNSPNCSSS
jgi:hypothetical protein